MPIVDFPEKKPPVVALWGLANRKNRWSLSWKGWLCLLLLSLGVFGIFLRTIHPFLAVTDRIDTDTMVVEGWIGQTDLVQVVDEYRRGHYQRVYTTGGPVHGVTEYQNDYSTSAHIAAQTLIKLGLPSGVVQSVPSHVRDRDRTFCSATALRDWIRAHDQKFSSFVVVTESVHARRSRLLFQKAFGGDIQIGVLALPNSDYDAAHWWRFSEGVKSVVSEGAAYLYVRLFFQPGAVDR